MTVDMSRMASIRAFADAFVALRLPLHVLVHNAGASSEAIKMTEEGLEENMALNFTGVVLLTSLLLPIMKVSPPAARVVLVASSAHFQGSRQVGLSLADCKHPVSGWVLYGSGKLNLTAYSMTLGAHLETDEKASVTVCSLDPGFVATPFYGKSLPFPISLFAKGAGLLAKTPEEGAHTALLAALQPSPPPQGAYLADTVQATPSALARDVLFQEQLMSNTMAKLQKVAPWWSGEWF